MRLSGLSRLSRLSRLALVSAFAAVAAMADTNAPVTFREALKAITDKASAIDKARTPLLESAIRFEELRATEPYSTNTFLKAEINNRILSWCLASAFTFIKRTYDRDACVTKAEELCRDVLASKEFNYKQKERFASSLTSIHAHRGDFDAAEKVARDWIAAVESLQKPDSAALCRAWGILADVFRLQDRADDMVAALDQARKADPAEGTRQATKKAWSLGGLNDKVDAWWKELGDVYVEATFFADKNRKRCRDAALEYVLCETNNLGRRCSLASKYFISEDSPEALAALRLLGKKNIAKGCFGTHELCTLFMHGAYGRFVNVFEALSKTTNSPSAFAKAPIRRLYIISLGAVGRKADGATFAKICAGMKKNMPLDTLKFQVYEAILSGRDALPIIDQSPCSRKERMEATLSAARQCQIWDMIEDAEKYSAAYLKYAKPAPNRVAKVVWSDKPVENITDWRTLAKGLETHDCDIPFDVSLDFLETDVATGRGKPGANDGERPARMSFQTIADRNALHIFIVVEDKEARLVESGYKGGIGTEMYFAPGFDQPYICFGSSPQEGVSWDFQTSYSSAVHKRLDRLATKGPHFRSEVAFTDSDYVLHVVFPWDDFYQKLPSPKAEWKFECISWCPDGPRTWGGSIGVHNFSRWGTLAIDLTPGRLAEIRRGILLRTAKGGWRLRPFPYNVKIDYFDHWADPAVGDPAFFEECLKPLQDELAGYARRIKPDMTDEEVNEIYEKALVRMKGLKYEIDALRRDYLARKLTE